MTRRMSKRQTVTESWMWNISPGGQGYSLGAVAIHGEVSADRCNDYKRWPNMLLGLQHLRI